VALVVFAALFAASVRAATPAEEKAFLARYEKAFESKDERTLQSFLYTKGADPMVVEFYEAMQSSGIGSEITRIALVPLTAEEERKAGETQDSPSGKVRLPFSPTRKLVLEVKEASSNGSSTSTSECYVGEVDGRLVILVPAPVK
jgi:hypothetical protein